MEEEAPLQLHDQNPFTTPHKIRNHIECRRCVCFVKSKSSDLCECGYERDQHEERRDIEGPWNHETHCTTEPTDAFGEIEFVGYGEQRAMYVKVDIKTDMDRVLDLLTNVWNLRLPKLLISVTGGAKDFSLRTRLEEAFRRGLRKAAQIPGAWIVTCGTYAGVMKHVGEAVRDFHIAAAGEEGRLTTIGIAPWGCVQNKEKLKITTNDGPVKPHLQLDTSLLSVDPVRYQIQGEDKDHESHLDPNHSHFILVDDGTQHTFGTEIPFRAAFEKRISEICLATGEQSQTDSVKVPVALIVLEGGPNTLRTVKKALKKGTPAIVIKGSGRCADILAEAVHFKREMDKLLKRNPDGRTKMQAATKLSTHVKDLLFSKEMFKRDSEEDIVNKHVEMVLACLNHPNLLSVYELDAKGKTGSDVDMAILKGLLKAKRENYKVQLELALAWNRVDVAKSEILTDGRRWTTEQLADVMMQALKQNKTDFVELFLDNGLSLKDFLTKARLQELYNWVPKNTLLRSLLDKHKVKKTADNPFMYVGHLLQELMGKHYQSHYCQVPCFADHAQELFIWSVLMGQQEMAKLFWEKGPEPTAAALVARQLLNAMKDKTKDPDVVKTLEENAKKFEDLATDLLNTCYFKDKERALKMLVRQLPQWGNSSCALIALKSSNELFISQAACQQLIESVWMGRIAPETKYWKILTSMFLFPFIFCMITFENGAARKVAENKVAPERNSDRSTKSEGNERPCRESPKSYWKMFEDFYHAPVVIFYLSTTFYLAFLTLYSYILLVRLSPTFHFVEVILVVWVLSIFLEEIRQILAYDVDSVRSDKKNLLDVLTFTLFVLGYVLRAVVWAWGQPCMQCYQWGRVILAIDLVLYFFRIFNVFAIHPQLGPKVLMIFRMITDLKWFLVVLLVFVASYAISSEAILYPKTELSWKLLYHLPRKAYWQIYGELSLDEIEGDNPNCTDDPMLYEDYSQPRCRTDIGKYLVPILLGFYMLFTNVLLLNILIAMFSNTFQEVQDRSDILWHFQEFKLIFEYAARPACPPPLTIISFVLRLYYRCRHPTTNQTSYFKKDMAESNEGKQLMQWESITLSETYLARLEQKEAESVDGRVKVLVERLETIQSKVDYLYEIHTSASEEAEAASLRQGVSPAFPAAGANPRSSIAALQQVALRHQQFQQPEAHPQPERVSAAAEPNLMSALLSPRPAPSDDTAKRLEKRFEAMEMQVVKMYRGLNWVIRSLEARNIVCDLGRPEMADDREADTHQSLGSSTHTADTDA